MLIRPDLTFNGSTMFAEAWRRTRRDEINGLLCSTDGRPPAHVVARLAKPRTLTTGGAGH
jgi:hypothetical protein